MGWDYLRRPDGLISVTIDNNAWDYFWERNLDLAQELPPSEFALFIPRHVEIEIEAIPDTPDKRPLRAFIRNTIDLCHVETSSNFGFYVEGQEKQRYSPLSFGTFLSDREADIHAAVQHFIKSTERDSGLFKNEADAQLAVDAFSSVVATNEKPNKPGPLRFAKKNGGRILYLRSMPRPDASLRENIMMIHGQQASDDMCHV